MKLKTSFLTLLMFLLINVAFALDSLSVSFNASHFATGCDDTPSVGMYIKNPNSSISLTHDTITIVLANGLQWTSTPDSNISTDSSILKFVIYSIGPLDSLPITFYIHGNCSLILDSAHTDSIKVQYTDTSAHFYPTLYNFITESPQPTFESIPSTNLQIAAYYDTTFTRTFVISNNGSTTWRNGTFDFIDYNGPAVIIDTIWVVSDSSTTTTINTIITGEGHYRGIVSYLLPGAFLYINEKITVIGCLDSTFGNSTIDLKFGCGGVFCDSIMTNAVVYESTLYPYPYFIPLGNTFDNQCAGGSKHWTIAIVDTSIVPAQNLYFWFENDVPPYTIYTLLYGDSIKISYGDSTKVRLVTDTVKILNPSDHLFNDVCYSAVQDSAVSTAYYYFDDMKKGDTIFVNFATYDCCPSSLNVFDTIIALGQTPAYFFNHWRLTLQWADGACYSPHPSIYPGWFCDVDNYYSPYLQLNQNFQPPVLDMPGSDTAWLLKGPDTFYVTNTSYHHNIDSFYQYNYQNGFLKVEILCDLGLVYNPHSCYFSSYTGSRTWMSFNEITTDTTSDITVNSISHDTAYIYFALDSFLTQSSLDSFLVNSRINFQLYSYCPADTPYSNYSITTYLENNSTCTECQIPLNQEGNHIFVLCPGCVTPGFQAISYSILRNNVGLKDTNNDAIADLPHQPANLNQVDRHRAIVGDTLESRFYADIVDGDPVTGITLDSLYHKLAITQFNYCYLYTKISNAPNLEILDVKVTINSDSSSVIQTLDGLNGIVGASGGQFLYDLSLATLFSYGLDTNYKKYSINDKFTVITTYRVASNLPAVTPYYQMATINNKLYLTGAAETLLSHPDTIAEAGVPVSTLRVNEEYWCVAADGIFYFYDVLVQNGSGFYDAISHDNCLKEANCIAYSQIGDGSNRVFPFEYRVPPYADTIKIIVPNGYRRISTSSVLTYPYFINPNWDAPAPAYVNTSVTPDLSAIVGGDSVFYFYLTSHFDTLTNPPLQIDYLTSNLPLADEIFSYSLNIIFVPLSCRDTADTVYKNSTANILPTIIFGDPEKFLGDSIITYNNPIGYGWDYHAKVLKGPSKSMVSTVTSSEQQALTRDVCWNFTIKNQEGNDPIEYIWAHVYSPSHRILLDEVYISPSPTPLTVSDSIIHLDNLLNPGVTATFQICCTYLCNTSYPLDTVGVTDTMFLYYGWNCAGYPVSFEDTAICNRNIDTFVLQQTQRDFQATLAQPYTANNCDTLHYGIKIIPTGGSFYDFKIALNLPQNSFLLPNSDSLFFNSVDVPAVGPYLISGTLNWSLDSSSYVLNTGGISGGDSLYFSFALVNPCGFSADSVLRASIIGVSYCGDTLTKNIVSPQFYFLNCYPLTATIDTITNVLCYGEANGSAHVNVTGGTSPYSYHWYSSGGTNAIATGLPAYTYLAVVTDANGCTAFAFATITQPAEVTFTTSHTNVSCNGGSNGTITVTGSGGITPYVFSRNGGSTYQSSNLFSGLIAGTYTIIIKDSNNCLSSETNVVITQPVALAFTTTHGDEWCYGYNNGYITITASGGVSPYSYSDDGGSSYQTSNIFSGLYAGTYDVVVKDADGCTSTTNVTITQPMVVSLTYTQTNVNCNGESNGSITITGYGGDGSFTYSDDDGSSFYSSNTFSGLAAGTYSIEVQDANSCLSSVTDVVITQPAILTALISGHTDLLCNDVSSGVASVSVAGGTAPYSYLWSPSAQTGATATDLNAGIYIVTVTDTNGCTATATVGLTQPPLLTSDAAIGSVSCLASPDGTGEVIQSGGIPPYTYLWSPSGGTNATASGLPLGSYTVTVTDSHGCTSISFATFIGFGDSSCCAHQAFETSYGLHTSAIGSNFGTAPTIGIYGILYVDNIFDITGKQVYLDPNAKIIISSSGRLTINNSILQGCSAMWDGIYDTTYNPVPNLVIENNSLIRDALNAVVSRNGGNYEISNTIFDFNYKDIVVDTFAGTHLGTVISSNFQCSGTLLFPHIGQRTSTGILITDVSSINIGSAFAASYLNNFSNMDLGIVSTGSNVTVMNNNFNNITGYLCPFYYHAPPCPIKGVAIWSQGIFNKLIVGGSAPNQLCNFSNCTNAIVAKKINKVFIEYNHFTDVGGTTPLSGACVDIDSCLWGESTFDSMIVSSNHFTNTTNSIYFGDNVSCKVWMESNNIDTFSTGIHYMRNSTCNINVLNNFLNFGSSSSATGILGIVMANIATGYNTINILSNKIRNVNKGIWMVLQPNAVISGNSIYFGTMTGMKYGIQFQHSSNIIADTNTIEFPATPASSNENTLFGISAESSSGNNTFVTENYITSAGTGIRFYNGSPVSLTTCNSLYSYYDGFQLNNSNIGRQPTPHNYPQDNYWSSSSKRDIVTNDNLSGTNNWYVHVTPYSTDPWSPQHPELIYPSSPPIIEVLNTNASKCATGGGVSNGKEIMEKVAEGTDTLDDQQYYRSCEYFYEQFKTDSCWQADAILVHFYDSLQSTNLGQLVDVRDLIAIDSLSEASTILASITPGNLYEQNAITVDTIYIQTWAIDSIYFDSLQTVLLTNIANQNPICGGVAVYDARVLLGIDVDDTTVTACSGDVGGGGTDGGRKAQVNNSNSTPQFNLYPNPNNGNMQLDYFLDKTQIGKLIIYNILGEKLSLYTLKQGNQILEINEQNLNNGVYLGCIFVDENIVKTVKLVIIK